LPLIAVNLKVMATVPHLFGDVRKQRVGEFVRDRIPHSAPRSVRIELDPHPPAPDGNSLRIANGRIGRYFDSEKVRERQRIEWRTLPSAIHAFKSHRACTRGYLGYGIVTG